MTKRTIAFLNFPNAPNDSRQDNMAKEGSGKIKKIFSRLQMMRHG